MKILTGQLPKGSLYQGSFYHTVGMSGHYSFRGKPPSEKRRLLDSYKKFMFYIGKMETFVADAKYILDKAGVDGKLLTASEELFRSGNEILAIRDFAKGILFFRRSKNCKPTYLVKVVICGRIRRVSMAKQLN
nr:hypothetical protein BaRGS_007762 [Batillaria attramentaria]